MPPKASLETRKKIYRSLCYVLSDRASQVAWDEYTPADWDLFAQMADREGVAPLMYWKLKDSPIEVAPSTFNFLRSTYYQTLAQNTLMYQELDRILRALDEVGIPVIVLKGAALAATVYEDIGLRPMGDLDLLVHPDVLGSSLKVFLSCSYAIKKITSYHAVLTRATASQLTIELHWNLVRGEQRPAFDRLDQFLERVEPFRPSSVPVSLGRAGQLSPGSHWLYLAGHLLMKHPESERRLLWYYDLHALLERRLYYFDSDQLVAAACALGWRSAVAEGLADLRGRFGTPGLDGLIQALGEAGDPDPDPVNRIRYSPAPFSIFNLLDWPTRLSLLWDLLFLPPDRIRRRYGREGRRHWLRINLDRWISLSRSLIYHLRVSRIENKLSK
jgi:hypothetical protein